MVAIAELISDASSPADLATKFEDFKGALNKSMTDWQARKGAGQEWIPPHLNNGNGAWIGGRPAANAEIAEKALGELTKAVTPEVLASIRAELAKTGALAADIAKDFSLTSPLSTGVVPFDLEAPSKKLYPVMTPLRNRIPRVAAQGLARRYKRITGISGSGTGGVANLSPFINDTSTISVGSLTLRRGPKISYAADEKTINYKQMGASDVVTWSAEFAGQGFEDIRQLSQTSLLYASMLADERALLAARGTDAGYAGALATPAGGQIVLTVRNAGVGEVGNSANIATNFIRVAAEGMFGDSIASSEVTTTGLSAATGKVIDVTMTGAPIAGATGYKIFAGTATGLANQFLNGRTGAWGGVTGLGTAAFTIQFTGAGTGGAINAGATGSASETASSADAFDGILTVCLDPTQSGAIRSVGGKLSTTSPGSELQDVFAALWTGGVPGVTGATAGGSAVKSRPNVIWAAGVDRKQLSNTVTAGQSGNPMFFYDAPIDPSAMRLGILVSRVLNATTGDEVPINVHPWLNPGNMLVLSESLPIPDSQVPNCFEYCLPQDYMGLNWPVIQHTYDIGSYWFGALVQPAPMFQGAVTNILTG